MRCLAMHYGGVPLRCPSLLLALWWGAFEMPLVAPGLPMGGAFEMPLVAPEMPLVAPEMPLVAPGLPCSNPNANPNQGCLSAVP